MNPRNFYGTKNVKFHGRREEATSHFLLNILYPLIYLSSSRFRFRASNRSVVDVAELGDGGGGSAGCCRTTVDDVVDFDADRTGIEPGD